jgi:hypothetical protein
MLTDDLKIELDDLCQDNELHIDFNFNHPISVTVMNSMQVGFYEGVPDEACVRWKFGIDKIDIEFVGNFRLDAKLFSKLDSKIKKLHYIYLQEQHAQKENRYKNGVHTMWTTCKGDKVALVKGWYRG